MYDLNVLFYLKKTKKNKAGEATICLIIKSKEQRAEVAIRKNVTPDIWDSKSQRAK